MRITKPNISHISDTVFKQEQRLTISTIDIIENYLATGSDDTNIKIWDIPLLLQNQVQTPKVLNYHHSSVVCVRFVDKDTLISISVDGMLAVWVNFQVVGTCSNAFIPHDLAISHDKALLAICNINGDCEIYKMAKSPIRISVIHLDYPIKSICFDPLKQFIALLSTREIAIYDITQVELPQLVQSFKKQIDKSTEFYSLKCSYSPDGQQLAVPNCLHSKLPVCLLLSRDLQETSLVGLVDSVTSTCFSPKLYNRSSFNQPICSIVAIVSNDDVLSLWISCSYKPLLIIRESLFDDAISDLQWHNDGLTLAISSLDGTVTLINFKIEELGVPLTEEETENYLKTQGISKVSSAPISLKEIELQRQALPVIPKVPLNKTAAPVQPQISQPVQQQKVTIGKDGKKRIQPTTQPLLPPVPTQSQQTMVPIYDVTLQKDEKLILSPIKEQLQINHKGYEYTVINNMPDKNYSEIRVKTIGFEFKRILETDPILFISAIQDYILTISVTHELQLFSMTLCQIALPILLESQIFCFCKLDNSFAILTQRGIIEIYSVTKNGLKLHMQCELTPVLRNENIQRINLNAKLEIVLYTAKATFIYNEQLKKWMKSSASEFEILNDRYEIKDVAQISSILNAQGNLKSAATRQYLEVFCN